MRKATLQENDVHVCQHLALCGWHPLLCAMAPRHVCCLLGMAPRDQKQKRGWHHLERSRASGKSLPFHFNGTASFPEESIR